MAEQRGNVRVETSDKRVRVLFGGRFVVDTVEARLVWDLPYYPTYYFPVADVLGEVLEKTGETERSPSRGTADLYDVRVGDEVAPRAALRYPDPDLDELRDLVRLEWGAMDAWFEEDDEVYVHPRDPHKRIDVLPSSRRVEIIVDDIVVADSRRPVMLHETSLPTRFYLPQTDLRLDLLTRSDHTSGCPYKGTAEYWHLDTGTKVHENAVWTYRFPTLEVAPIARHAAFYNEHVDIRLDGLPLDRPRSPFS